MRGGKPAIPIKVDDGGPVVPTCVEVKGHDVSTRVECEECRPFDISTWDTTGAVRDIQVGTLTDEEKRPAQKK